MANIDPDKVNQAQNILENAQSIAVTLPVDPSVDKVASALSLYLSLSAAGKQVTVACSTRMTVQYNELIGVDKISTVLTGSSGRNLVISFPYQEGSIEKVSYNIENDKFNLVIEPREGFPTITQEMMKYSSSGGNIDAIVTVGCSQLEELWNLYSNNQDLYNGKQIINLDNASNNNNFAKINIVDTSAISISELMNDFINQLGLNMEPDIATNLLAGLTSATDNFSSGEVTASTFETAANLLKQGARKKQIRKSSQAFVPQMKQPAAPTAPIAKSQKTQFGLKTSPTPQTDQSQQSGQRGKFQPPQFQRTQQQPGSDFQQQKPPVREAGKSPETPPDWLKPKIYKGSTLI